LVGIKPLLFGWFFVSLGPSGIYFAALRPRVIAEEGTEFDPPGQAGFWYSHAGFQDTSMPPRILNFFDGLTIAHSLSSC